MSRPSPRNHAPLPTGRGWWLVAAASALGLAFFMVLWLGQRDDEGLYRPDEQPPAAAAPAFKPLPTPSTSGVADKGAPAPLRDSGARIDEPGGAARPSDAMPATGPGAEGAPRGAASAPPVEVSASSPVPIESPGPRYPARALRRGESGEVLLRIHVDARGLPSRVDVVSSSGSRDLDRAAQSSARRWRFRPAMRDGSPVAGVVNVPITFDRGP